MGDLSFTFRRLEIGDAAILFESRQYKFILVYSNRWLIYWTKWKLSYGYKSNFLKPSSWDDL